MNLREFFGDLASTTSLYLMEVTNFTPILKIVKVNFKRLTLNNSNVPRGMQILSRIPFKQFFDSSCTFSRSMFEPEWYSKPFTQFLWSVINSVSETLSFLSRLSSCQGL